MPSQADLLILTRKSQVANAIPTIQIAPCKIGNSNFGESDAMK